MTTAEKLTTIAENVPKVYNSGKSDGYNEGYEVGKAEGGDIQHSDYINPEWTDWRYFSYYNSRNNLVAQLKSTDTSNGTDFSRMLYGCTELETKPSLDTSNGTNFSYMFYNCKKLTGTFTLNTQKGVDFSAMFQSCSGLTMIFFNTRNGTNFRAMFSGCNNMEHISGLDLSQATDVASMFSATRALTYINFYGSIPIGISLVSAPLTADSAKHAIRKLVNYAGTDNAFTQTISFSSKTWGYLDAEGNASPNGNSWREYINDLGWNAS